MTSFPPPTDSAIPSAAVSRRALSISAILSLVRWVAVGIGLAVVIALPWLWQSLVWVEWLGIAAALMFTSHLRGWRGELATLLTAALGLGIAFHWAPKVLAYSMQTSDEIGLLFAIPIVFWDAARLSLPFWCVSRLIRDPRNAWLPAGLTAVVAEAVFGGVFPWKLGYSQIGWPVTIQAADIFGPEWTTFILFAHAGAILSLASAALGRPRGFTPIGLAAIVLVVANLAYGTWAIQHHAAVMGKADTISVALVQVDPSYDTAVADLQRLTKQACDARRTPFDIVCWPECAGGTYEDCLKAFSEPDLVYKHSREPNRGLRPLEDPVCPLLFGGKIYCGYPEKPRQIYQSAILIDGEERMVGRYDKRHLMPFGEYVPFGDQFPQLRHYFPMQDEFDVGSEANVLSCGRARLGVMLCYEDMVPGAAVTLVRNSANLLVSLINGAAFTEPLTLAQHRLLAQLRAVENRRCLLRCAATGETCLITPLGTIAASLPIHTKDVLTAEVPLLETRTISSRIGPAFPIACGLALAAMAYVFSRSKSP